MPAKNCYHFTSCMYKDQNISLCRPNKCGHYEKVKKLTDVQQLQAGEQTPTNSVRDAIALNTLRNKFEEIYRVHGQGGASYLYQEMMREFDEFIVAQQHP